jgi:hypothetical protein
MPKSQDLSLLRLSQWPNQKDRCSQTGS